MSVFVAGICDGYSRRQMVGNPCEECMHTGKEFRDSIRRGERVSLVFHVSAVALINGISLRPPIGRGQTSVYCEERSYPLGNSRTKKTMLIIFVQFRVELMHCGMWGEKDSGCMKDTSAIIIHTKVPN